MITKKKDPKDNVIGWNTDNKNTFSTLGNYYVGDNGKNLTFVRSPEKLLKQYSNLLHKLGKQYGDNLNTAQERQDLYAYITNTFIELVLEYDMENDVDFPGYIARMLKARISGSYLNKSNEYNRHISPIGSPDTSIESLGEELQGASGLTYSKSISSNYQAEMQKDGVVRGLDVKMVSKGKDGDDDYSLFYVHDQLNRTEYASEAKHALIDAIGKGNLSPSEAKKLVAQQLNLDDDTINYEYAELRNFLIKFS